MNIVLAIVAWIVCGVLARGLVLGFFTRRFPDQDHHGIAALWVAFGPFSLIVELLTSRIKDFRWKHLTEEEQYAIFHKRYPVLSREDFERYR